MCHLNANFKAHLILVHTITNQFNLNNLKFVEHGNHVTYVNIIACSQYPILFENKETTPSILTLFNNKQQSTTYSNNSR
jgi:hypothetical protein